MAALMDRHRLPDWADRLSSYIESAVSRPYDPETWDCARFAAGAVEAVVGVRPDRGIRWASKAGGLRALRRRGFDDLSKFCDAIFGKRVAPLALLRGDLALHAGAVGVVWSGGALFVGVEDERDGLVKIDLADVEAGWIVGARDG